MYRDRIDRVVDVASVVLISVAAVLTAFCTYQSARWDGEQSRLYNIANGDRTAAAEALDRSNVMTAINVGIFLRYIDAVDRGDRRMAEFLDRRLPPELRPAMQAWLASRPLQNPRAPSSPFVMRQYTLATRAEARGANAQAAKSFEDAIVANGHADEFILLTVIFAGVSFLAGISTKMVYPRHAIIVGLAVIGTVYGVLRLLHQPFL